MIPILGRIKQAFAPAADEDAVNKKYVDDVFAALGARVDAIGAGGGGGEPTTPAYVAALTYTTVTPSTTQTTETTIAKPSDWITNTKALYLTGVDLAAGETVVIHETMPKTGGDGGIFTITGNGYDNKVRIIRAGSVIASSYGTLWYYSGPVGRKLDFFYE